MRDLAYEGEPFMQDSHKHPLLEATVFSFRLEVVEVSSRVLHVLATFLSAAFCLGHFLQLK
jgi:hypothetical protein